MADIQFKTGEQSPVSLKGKKFKFNKKTMLIVGGIGIVAFLVLSRLMRSNQPVEYVGTAYGDEYGSNSVDTAAAAQNIMGEVENMLSSNNTMMADQINQTNQATAELITGIMQDQEAKFQAFSVSNQDTANAYSQMILALQEQLDESNQKMDGVLENINKPITAPITPPTNKTPTTADTQRKLTSAENQKLYLSNLMTSGTSGQKIWARQQLESMGKTTTAAAKPATAPAKTTATPTKKYTSVVDLLKAQGKDSSMANRQKIAANLGIKNYKGTAAQNTQMIKLLNK